MDSNSDRNRLRLSSNMSKTSSDLSSILALLPDADPRYTENVPVTEFQLAAFNFCLGKEDYLQILYFAKLRISADYGPPNESFVPMTSEAAASLRQFIASGAKSWKFLVSHCRYMRRLRTCRNIQSTLRSWLFRRRIQRAVSAENIIVGLFAFYRSSFQLCVIKRRAALLIQSHWRAFTHRRAYLRGKAELRRHFAAKTIQRFCRNFQNLKISKTIRRIAKIAKSVDCMQKNVRRFFCTKILFLRAVYQRRQEAVKIIQTIWRSVSARRRVKAFEGFRVVALHAKLISLALASTQTQIAKAVRGYLARKSDAWERGIIRGLQVKNAKNSREKRAAVKIQSWLRGRFGQWQFWEIRRAALLVQTRLRTTLAPLYGPS